ncbi:crotonobetainyl-CoA:carnitine CoA-transferase CaiB-like acyl-CoA transferase [Planktotalea frisia]|jgi:crotonobetainyl-CoA:carnitine CoA-transferase CaiB-like acyl-CoA transferase|uniref:Succinyl-CoA:(R)-benzylsuccinate CoA-transferase subunit BbsF n=1 Tax=Planktotalea frisia TaxID=696762 RepID=A0A1L9NUT9_9RHOB|nr:CoA transferase [Planktotalea frisia]OJI92952.1 succinyl-CoA:(R)-benzylsuccinate CoA-transferase subunit BbsF [Planktotalea frisia]PZX25258.1 crotonobetainyl-CoA:carnitine CoA-transferase CaiB-like acyl-CoA transferase [Planktotalea frisia]
MSPLEGLKVVELARILAGPWIGQTLADLGAEVTKVESPDGDDTRTWGPPFMEHNGVTSAAYFYGCNRGKTGLRADLKTPEGIAAVKALVAEADIFIENFKVGGLAKYELDFESLRALNPRLIYCSVTGFGQSGPLSHRPGYDFLLQGMSGLMSVTGEPGSSPQKVGVAVTDIVTGLYGTIGILSAVQQRHTTGKGQHIDMSLLDCATAMMANQNMNYLATGQSPTRAGNAHPNICPYDVFETADGHIILAVGNDGQFQRCCDVLGLSWLAKDPQFESNQQRVKHRKELMKTLAKAVLTWPSEDLLAEMSSNMVPAGPINSVGENLTSEHAIARGLVIDPEGVKGVRTPIIFSDAELKLKRSVPR